MTMQCSRRLNVLGARPPASLNHLMILSPLMSVPNVSEGRDQTTINAISVAFSGTVSLPKSAAHAEARLLDTHTDADHHRSVYTLAGSPGTLADALLSGIAAAVERIDVVTRAGSGVEVTGQHPHVGAVDVVPIVYLHPDQRGQACAEALVVADRIGHELHVPVFMYGELSSGGDRTERTRAEFRRGGVSALAARMADPEQPLTPDFGPSRLHATAGATLVAARPPLVAFNLQLEPPATLDRAREIATLIREGGTHGLPGLRAIGVMLEGEVAQVSMNVERPFEVSLAQVLSAVQAHCEVASAELVGLAPAAALEGFPEDVQILGFDPARHLIENALG
jgi:glutamate formiminotransferase/glutamate formiminotransferase/formiminotetrahydrofolate cyclodeaminase